MTINEALKQTYVRAGGVEDLESIDRKVEILNAISELFGGKSDAVSVAQAIENISEVVQPTTLIEKTVTTNGEYSASDDDATGYSKVTVNVVNENNAKFVIPSNNQFALQTALESVSIPDGCTRVASSAFNSCSRLKDVSIPNTVTAIDQIAFASCTSLLSIEIPNSVSSIYSNAFNGCTNLQTITINKPEGSIEGAPWGATNAQVIWTG